MSLRRKSRILAIVLSLLIGPADVALGQLQDPSPMRDPVTIDELVLLLEVGVQDGEIVSFAESRGWPPSIAHADVRRIGAAGAGPALKARLLARLVDRADFSGLAEAYETFDGSIKGGPRFSILVPRGWVADRPSEGGRRHAWHEHDLDGWFRRTSFFLWFVDLGPWEEQNAPALARIVYDAVKDRMADAGIVPGEPSDGLLESPDGHPFRFIYSIFTDTKTTDRGIMGLALRLEKDSGLIAVAGFSTHLASKPTTHRAPRDMLAEMLGSLKIRR